MSGHAARAIASLLSLAGCVSPQVMVVDQKTALERQAAGGYPGLENELEQAGLAPAPEPFTRQELALVSERRGEAVLGEIGELYARGEADAEVIDRYLLQKCLGEARSGLLVPRPTDCVGAADTSELARVLGRENLHRHQLWELLAREQGASLEQVREVWHTLHLEQVVCNGLIERASGWEPKPC